MVSQDSPPNPTASGILHQFLISDSIATQTQFENQHLEAYGADLRSGGSTYHPSLGVLPALHSLQESEVSPSRHLTNLFGASNEANHQNQRAPSLSLGYTQRSLTSNLLSPGYLISEEETTEACNPGMTRVPDDFSFPVVNQFYGTESVALAISNSNYLKPAQSLLREVVSVGGKAVLSNEKSVRSLSSGERSSLGLCSELKAELCNNGLYMEKHELQAKVAKLIALLEEVERRFEQYYQHMEELVSSFEVIAGLGTGKSYTALALQAMSRHFCSLRDAIVAQIHATRRRVAQDMPRISTDLSQLSLFDRETRHSRMHLQHLGMSQSPRQAWRPIRGLPETSVAILRSWLFEHFLHPYPNDNEKLMLASQTGLSKNQVSNWFINARVRLWKPMIEEMYKEEFLESQVESNPPVPSSSAEE
ncbi:hypothetical protein RJ640_020892 [Escallonia rubra]|uniref:Homeobox domain-containing protein n=1 Tax=Escallonia rubra TaxID=112253 RepID=A0AA88R290_9ASTE|nr:hypothetical protein RJ640_020892 [Escallonia rubra]